MAGEREGDILEYYEITITGMLGMDLYYNQVNQFIAQIINKSILSDMELSKMHEENIFKYYCFSGLYPTEKSKTYCKGRIYAFDIRTINMDIANKLLKLLVNHKTNEFKVLAAKLKKISPPHIEFIKTITPTIITIDNKPWLTDSDVITLTKRLHSNLEHKYNTYFNKDIRSEQNFIQNIKVLNEKPIAMHYKKISLLGNKFLIKVNEDEMSQNLAVMALGCSLGEKGSSIGAGYCVMG